MKRIEKTVFISYRRQDIAWALAVYQYLTKHDFDVFFDYTSLSKGKFKQIIISNINARAHFLVILTPSALDRCKNPQDWLRLEIETAIHADRNIIPLFFDGFNFDASSISEKISGKLASLQEYNGLEVPPGYFSEAMDRLRKKYLGVSLDAVLYPLPGEVREVVNEQQVAANEAFQWDFNKLPDQVRLNDIEFCLIPAGPFLMGSAEDNELADVDEKPQHKVNIPYNYWLAKFPVMNEQYSLYVAAAKKAHPIRNWPRKKDHPIVKITYRNAMDYCEWLTGLFKNRLPPGYTFRLPTEAEWEKASRGQDGREWPWGNQFSSGDQIAELNCHCKENKIGKTLPVDAYFPQGKSPYQIADMVGNVWEWTWSLLKPYPYNPKEDGRENKSTPGERVIRGGAYDKTIESVRCACRSRLNPSYKLPSVGFRVVIAPPIADPANLAFPL